MIVALAGRIGAGKSTIADAVATSLGAARTSFGSAVRSVATERGLPTDRDSLQSLGEQLIEAEGWEHFAARVLPDGGGLVVIDGIRHVAAVPALRDLARPRPVVLVFVDASQACRAARLAARDGVGPAAFAAAEQHANEAQAGAVRELADVIVANDTDRPSDLSVCVATIANCLKLRSVDDPTIEHILNT